MDFSWVEWFEKFNDGARSKTDINLVLTKLLFRNVKKYLAVFNIYAIQVPDPSTPNSLSNYKDISCLCLNSNLIP